MDQFRDDLEFQPLTQGLGFRNKVKKSTGSPDQSPSTQKAPHHLQAERKNELRDSNAEPKHDYDDLMDPLFGKTAAPSATAPFRSPHSSSNSISHGASVSSSGSASSMPGSTSSRNEAPRQQHSLSESQMGDANPLRSLSELMASLPPSLDFIEEPSAPTPLSSEPPQIYKPLPRARVEEMVDRQAMSKSGEVPQRELLKPAPAQVPADPQWAKKISTSAMPLNESARSAPARSATEPALPLRSKVSPQKPDSQRPKSRLDESLAKAFPKSESVARTRVAAAPVEAAPTTTVYLRPVATAWAAGAMDFMVVSGLTLIALFALIKILNIDLLNLVLDPRTSIAALFQLGVLVAGIVQIYMLTARCVFTQTLGEWAFDVQLGTPDDQKKISYPFLVLVRSLFITLTGFILFPLLSTITRRDFGSLVSGLQLYLKQ